MSEINPCPVCKHPSGVFKIRIDPCDNVIGSVSCYQCCIGIDVNIGGDEQATKVATIRAWNSLSAPTDRRCGTCAAWQGIRGDEGGVCRALPMLDSHHRSQLLDENKDGGQCALWRLRGAE